MLVLKANSNTVSKLDAIFKLMTELGIEFQVDKNSINVVDIANKDNRTLTIANATAISNQSFIAMQSIPPKIDYKIIVKYNDQM